MRAKRNVRSIFRATSARALGTVLSMYAKPHTRTVVPGAVIPNCQAILMTWPVVESHRLQRCWRSVGSVSKAQAGRRNGWFRMSAPEAAVGAQVTLVASAVGEFDHPYR
jgi:hypothetical protein